MNQDFWFDILDDGHAMFYYNGVSATFIGQVVGNS